MGTSLSGLTPATTFDGLLKVGDNDPLTADLKAISTGDGTDTMLELSTTALQIGGATGMYWDNANKRLGIGTDSPATSLQVNGAIRISGAGTQILEFSNASVAQFRSVFGSTGFRVGNSGGVFVGSTDGGPASSTRFHIKGSGTTSATTSLLVQNSAGTNIFKVVDDNTMFYHTHKFRSAGGYLYIDGEANTNRSLRIGQNFTASSFDGHIFKTFDGTSYSEAMRITGANDQFVGIGETTPTARLHVKGSGNDNTTTSLLVQNSDAENIMTITDDGYLTYRTPQRELLTLGNGSVLKYGTNSSFSALYNRASIYDGTNTTQFENGNVGIGNGTTTPSARLQVKGSGTTSATTALLVQNSAGTDLFKVADNGDINIDNGVAADMKVRISPTANKYLEIDRQGRQVRIYSGATGNAGIFMTQADKFSIGVNNAPLLLLDENSNVRIGSGITSADTSAKLQVDSTTQGFLPPRMTDAERDAIATPAAGLMIYDTTNNQMNYWNGSTWIAF